MFIFKLNEDQTVRLAIGAAGGWKIISGVAQAIINNIMLDYDVKTSLDKQRINPNVSSSYFHSCLLLYEKHVSVSNNSSDGHNIF